MEVSEATVAIVKAALDNNLLTLRDQDGYTEDAIAKNNAFNIGQLCSLIESVKNELAKADENYSPVSF